MFGLQRLKFFNQGEKMNFYEDEEFERKIEQITDQFGYLLMDIIVMSFKKINIENQKLKEFLDAKLQVHKEEAF
jgi:cupin superfamily acireductone dioxygenase involved in methionine salvage